MKTSTIIRVFTAVIFIIVLAIVYKVSKTLLRIRQDEGSNIKVIDPTLVVSTYSSIGLKNINLLSSGGDYFYTGNIVLQNGFIQTITPTDSLIPNINYIEASGKYLIPGLIDTHVHLRNSKNDLFLYLANGVTTVFEMFGNDTHIKWKNDVKNGSVSPDIFVASRKVGSREGIRPIYEDWKGGEINIQSKKDIASVIQSHKQAGFDAIKISNTLNPELYNTLVSEANNQQIPVFGHLPDEVSLEKIYSLGQVQIAHVDELVKKVIKDLDNNSDDPKKLLPYIKEISDSIAKKLKANKIAVSTSIWSTQSISKQRFKLDDFLKSIPLQYVNSGIVEGSWLPGNNPHESNPGDSEYWDFFIQAIRLMTLALHDNGVDIMVGTDSNMSGAVPGFSIHDEMELLSSIGLPNDAVLKAATTTPTRFLNEKVGKIAVDYKADLVLLSENPLEDISGIKKIERVFIKNYSLDKGQISALLALIEEANNEKRVIDISKYQ